MRLLLAAADTQARIEGWMWWLALVVCLVAVLLVLASLRRWLVRPLSHHEPTDTSDAWAEAGRRMAVPPPDQEAGDAGSTGEGPP